MSSPDQAVSPSTAPTTRRFGGPRVRALLAAVGVVLVGGVAGAQLVSGQTAPVENVFVPISPCRLLDTRPEPDINLGPRAVPIGAGETVRFGAHDGNDDDSSCEVPASATAIEANVVAARPTEGGFLTLFPGDVENPGTASLNFVAGQAPTPNSITIPLAADGTFNVFNAFGDTDVIIDLAGYHQPSSTTDAIKDLRIDDEQLTAEIDELRAQLDAVTAAASIEVTTNVTDVVDSIVGVEQIDELTHAGDVAGTLVVSFDLQAIVGGTSLRCGIDGALSDAQSALSPGGILSGTRAFTFDPAIGPLTIELLCNATGGTSQVRDAGLTGIFIPTPNQAT